MEEGQLKDFALENFEKEKIVIYERKTERQGKTKSYSVEAIDNIFEFTKGTDFNNFSKNRILQFAIVKNVEIIGEAANSLSNEFRKVTIM